MIVRSSRIFHFLAGFHWRSCCIAFFLVRSITFTLDRTSTIFWTQFLARSIFDPVEKERFIMLKSSQNISIWNMFRKVHISSLRLALHLWLAQNFFQVTANFSDECSSFSFVDFISWDYHAYLLYGYSPDIRKIPKISYLFVNKKICYKFSR